MARAPTTHRNPGVGPGLKKSVEAELVAEPSVDAQAIRVAARSGIVTLSGRVASHPEKVAAEHAAARVLGVRAVVSEIEVRLPASVRLEDEQIARAAVDALSSNTAIPEDRVRVKVQKGWIKLEGDVDWGYQKAAASNAVSFLKGVKGVVNKIAIKPTSIRTSVAEHIRAALTRSLGEEQPQIKVESSGDHVTLRGAVRSLAERAVVERAAWTTPGVCHVNNNLTVRSPGRKRDE